MKYQNDLFLRTLNKETVERPPVWLMRQAGRILPQYRAIRSKLSGFVELVQTPELAAEVTIQPVDELGVDAAIIFSDILVIPEAMGLPYELIEKKGPFFPNTISSKNDIEKLIQGQDAASHLGYVYDAIKATVKGLNGRVPLIGFAGAPWTILSYMIEGQSSKTFSKAKGFLYKEPELAHQLLEMITTTTIAYLKAKIEAGVAAVQIFDSWAGILTPDQFQTFGLPYMRKIDTAIQNTPVILFARGAHHSLDKLADGKNAIGIDWTIDRTKVRQTVGNEVVLQGNLDPCFLYSSEDRIQMETTNMLKELGHRHIANLGHGVYPDTPLQNVKTFVNTVKDFRYSTN